MEKKEYHKKWYKKNKERMKKYQRDYYHKNKERFKGYREKSKTNTRKYQQQYRNKNKKRLLELQKEWLEKNPNYFKEYSKTPQSKKARKEWYEKNKPRHKKIKRKNRIRRLYNLSEEEYNLMTSICSICGFDKYLVDLHHKDFNKRNNQKDNLIGLCPNCHLGIHRGKIPNPF